MKVTVEDLRVAVAYADSVDGLGPSALQSRYSLAEYLCRPDRPATLRDLDEARLVLQRCTEILERIPTSFSPSPARVWGFLADVQWQMSLSMEDCEEARDLVRQAIADATRAIREASDSFESSDSSYARRILAFLLHRHGQQEQAIREMTEALEHDLVHGLLEEASTDSEVLARWRGDGVPAEDFSSEIGGTSIHFHFIPGAVDRRLERVESERISQDDGIRVEARVTSLVDSITERVGAEYVRARRPRKESVRVLDAPPTAPFDMGRSIMIALEGSSPPIAFSEEGRFLGLRQAQEFLQRVREASQPQMPTDLETVPAGTKAAFLRMVEERMSEHRWFKESFNDWNASVAHWFDRQMEIGVWYEPDDDAAEDAAEPLWRLTFKVNRRIAASASTHAKPCVELLLVMAREHMALSEKSTEVLRKMWGTPSEGSPPFPIPKAEASREEIRYRQIVDPTTLECFVQDRTEVLWFSMFADGRRQNRWRVSRSRVTVENHLG